MALNCHMRFISLICGAAFLSACASLPAAESSVAEKTRLPTSELKPGDCGLFGWSPDASRQFIFYADETTARYNSDSGPVDLIAQSGFPATDYTDPLGRPVTLRLGEGETMVGGMRYPSARLVSLNADGWERLQPVAIVRSCQPIS